MMRRDTRIDRVLVVVLDNLGDVVMATSVLDPLHETFPNAEIGCWTKEYSAPLFDGESLPHVVHASDPWWTASPVRPRGEWKRFREAWAEVRARRYDVAFVLNADWRRSLACRLAGIRHRVGADRRKSRLFLTHAVASPRDPVPPEEHRRLVETWAGATVGDEMWRPRLGVAPAAAEWTGHWLGELGWATRPFVVLHPVLERPSKCWPAGRWTELVGLLGHTHPELRFLFVCRGEDESRLRSALGPAPSDVWHVLTETETVGRLKGILARCVACIAGDSGPAHIAAALGRPVLSLFGATDPERFAPRGRNVVKVMRRVPLEALAADEVYDAAHQMIGAASSSRRSE